MQLIQMNGALYERKNLGNGFVGDIPSEATLKPGSPEMRWTGAKIPLSVWQQIAGFFQWSYAETKSETQARILFNPATLEYKAWAFPQKYGTGMTAQELSDEPSYAEQLNEQMAGGFITFGTVHHHCSAGAFQSGTDSEDENEMGIHVTLGNIGSDKHSIHGRVSLTIPGTLGDDGKMATVARHAFYGAVFSDWFDVGRGEGEYPEALREEIVKHVLTTPILSSSTFPAQWAANLIKHPAPVVHRRWEPSKLFPQQGGWQNPVVKVPSSQDWFENGLDGSIDYEEEDFDTKATAEIEKEVREIMEKEGMSFAHVHGIMMTPTYNGLEPDESPIQQQLENTMAALGFRWEDFVHE